MGQKKEKEKTYLELRRNKPTKTAAPYSPRVYDKKRLKTAATKNVHLSLSQSRNAISSLECEHPKTHMLCDAENRIGETENRRKEKKPHFFLSFLSLFLMCEQLQGCSLLCCGGGMGWEAVLN